MLDNALTRYDADGDGVFSATERETMEADFIERFDTDGNGALDEAEHREARRKSRVTVVASSPLPVTREAVASFVSRFDTDGNGTISANEAGERQWLVLQRADKNHDGQVSVDEWLARNTRVGTSAGQ
ncbi:MAG: EF-hand domain-containing protein [Akkermansiaceae bacterium]|nr:EF-hand domain-containing protein [Akkermansiaceae bacterium]